MRRDPVDERGSVAQLGVFGPLLLLALAGLLAAPGRWTADPQQRLLLRFVAPLLAIMTVQVLHHRANADCAAPAIAQP